MPGTLQSIGLQRVGHDLGTEQQKMNLIQLTNLVNPACRDLTEVLLTYSFLLWGKENYP